MSFKRSFYGEYEGGNIFQVLQSISKLQPKARHKICLHSEKRGNFCEKPDFAINTLYPNTPRGGLGTRDIRYRIILVSYLVLFKRSQKGEFNYANES